MLSTRVAHFCTAPNSNFLAKKTSKNLISSRGAHRRGVLQHDAGRRRAAPLREPLQVAVPRAVAWDVDSAILNQVLCLEEKAYVCSDFFELLANFAGALSRLYRRLFLKATTHFSIFFQDLQGFASFRTVPIRSRQTFVRLPVEFHRTCRFSYRLE